MKVIYCLNNIGRFRAAMARWQEALSIDPLNAVLLELMAQASMAVNDDFQAVQVTSGWHFSS